MAGQGGLRVIADTIQLGNIPVGQRKFALITTPSKEFPTSPAILCANKTRYSFATSKADLNLWPKGLAVHAELELHIGYARISRLQVQEPKLGAPLTGV